MIFKVPLNPNHSVILHVQIQRLSWLQKDKEWQHWTLVETMRTYRLFPVKSKIWLINPDNCLFSQIDSTNKLNLFAQISSTNKFISCLFFFPFVNTDTKFSRFSTPYKKDHESQVSFDTDNFDEQF